MGISGLTWEKKFIKDVKRMLQMVEKENKRKMDREADKFDEVRYLTECYVF